MGRKNFCAFTNQEVACLLREVAAAYRVKGGSFWEVRAYQNAASSVEHATLAVKDLWEGGQLSELPGVGEGIAGHLTELFRTGRVKRWERVKKGLPPSLFTFLKIPGVGAKNAYQLAKKLKVQSLAELKRAAQKGLVRQLSGFGPKKEQEILRGIDELKRMSGRMLLSQALDMAGQIVPKLAKIKGVVRVDRLGSVRRCVATVGDLDLAAAVLRREPDASRVIEIFVNLPGVQKVEEKGQVEAAVVWANGKRVDLRVQEIDSYGSLLQHFTGSKQHNIHLRKIAKEKGFSLSEQGIMVGKTKSRKQKTSAHKQRTKNRLKMFQTEEELYQFLGMAWIPPELREDNGEIEAAILGRLPRLVEMADIRGDLHLHCSYDLEESHDLGQSSMEEVVQKALELGYEYVVLGNHNPSVYNHSAKQMAELIKKKQRKIDKIRQDFSNLGSLELLNGVEVDILADGRLALPNSALKLLDVVVVSIHSGMRQSKEKLTKRVINALKNPYTHILGHPTGRLLSQREGYELDWEQIFTAAQKYHKAIEINSFDNRLDLPDILVREAVRRGVKLVVNTDAHHIDQMNLMSYGVSVARRGWAEKKDILNTRNWLELRKFLHSSKPPPALRLQSGG